MNLQGIVFIALIIMVVILLSMGLKSISNSLNKGQGAGLAGFGWILLSGILLFNIPAIMEVVSPALKDASSMEMPSMPSMSSMPDWLKNITGGK